ncbi:MAG: nuclear transport factor 2 family protein [Hyphomonadaceae bacterium]|nr:nuclear transport factor 2 family protein [Hyphomonadaceae bacterium]
MDLTRRLTLAAAPLALAACATTQGAGLGAAGRTLTESDFNAWLWRYKEAWETKNATAAGALFTENVIYREQPFEEQMVGRAAVEAYWTRVTAGQRDITFTHHVIMASGGLGVAEWHAAFTAVEGGAAIELDGVFVCHFADLETVSLLKEWWHIKVTPRASAG